MDWLKENTKSKTTGGFAEQGLKNEEEGSEFVPSSEILSSFPDEESVAEKKAEIRQEMELVREEREEKDNAVADQLIAIHGAKVKFNGHLGEFKVLNDVPTTQDKLTGTTIENQVTNFTFFDGFVLNSLATWQDVATVNYQDNEALIKKSTLPGVGKMPGNTPPESGKIEFLNSGQVHMPESLVTEGAPLLDYIQKQECFCTKEFTVEEIQNFVKAMRATEKIKTTLLFSEENCPIEKDAVGYIRLCNELNATMKKYNINSCIRKIHFLAQTYHESSRFGTTLEYSSGKRYNPGKHNEAKKMEHTIDGDGPRYKGRGIIQLTWRKTQKAYFSYKLSQDKNQFQGKEIAELFNRKPLYKEKYIYYKDKLDEKGKPIKNNKGKTIKIKVVEEVDVDSASLLARNMHFAFDSAGWYWENLGNVTATGENINFVADKDNVLKVSQCINGKVDNPYGLEKRKEFTKLLKELFNYPSNCTSKNKKQ